MAFTVEQFVAWGRLGGKRRAAKLSKKRRREIARKAGEARWAKKRNGAD